MGLILGDDTLLCKYRLSLNCLDYFYIEKSRNVREIEKILLVLRSGEEGIFPDLIKFCEKRLHELSPSNKLLEIEKRIITPADMTSRERQILNDEIMEWENQMKQAASSTHHVQRKLPPVRNSAQIMQIEKSQIENPLQSSNKFSGQRRSFGDWDKFDVEQELKKLDVEKKEPPNDVYESTDEIKSKLQPFVSTIGLSEKEKSIIAEKEKIKGNEAFRVKDYEEAEIYYSRSISAMPTIAALNNRAFTNFKLKDYTSALTDLHTVLGIDPHNIKAMYRRGLIYRETGRFQLAYMDFTNVLEEDPSNKAAKEQLQEMDKNPCSQPKDAKSVVIEEIASCKTAIREVETNSKSHPSRNNSSSSVSESSSIPQNYLKHESQKELSPKTLDFLTVYQEDEKPKKEGFLIREVADDTDFGKCHKEKGSLIKVEPVVMEKEQAALTNEFSCGNAAQGQENSKNEFGNAGDMYDSNQDEIVIETVLQPLEDGNNDACYTKRSLEMLNEKITPFRFFSLWHSMEANRYSGAAAMILMKVIPNQLPKLVSAKLDGDLLYGMIRGIYYLLNCGHPQTAYKLLLHLTDVARFQTVLSFLSKQEQYEVGELFAALENAGVEDEHNLEAKFLFS